MSKLWIEGGYKLKGELTVQGAKNSVLPILTGAFLTGGVCEIGNCPDLSDVSAAIGIMEHLGAKVKRENGTLVVDARQIKNCSIPYHLMREMRSSIVFLGAVIARCRQAQMSFPGGCELGPRPIDLHLAGLRRMGVHIQEEHGELICEVPDEITGCDISLSFPSVGATENIMLAAVTAKGVTTIQNAAREPEIVDFANFLSACGAHIKGAGESTIIIEGVEKLYGTNYSVMPDRIVAATYMCAAAATGGRIVLRNTAADHLRGNILPIFEQMGCTIEIKDDIIVCNSIERLRAPQLIRTMPYPGFPTDAQAPFLALCTLAQGTTIFVENIFENRYKHVSELMRLGADIKVEGRVAIVEGVSSLHGSRVEATELRGGAALVVAALAASGVTELSGLRYIDRGYEQIERALAQIGGRVRRR